MKVVRLIFNIFFVYVGISTALSPLGLKFPGRIIFNNEDFSQNANTALTLGVGFLMVATGVAIFLRKKKGPASK